MSIEDFRGFCVKVAGGSGCLIQPATREYSYVLTAKHVITDVRRKLADKDKIKIVHPKLSNGKIKDQPLNIQKIYLHSHKKKDAAIIKIDFYEEIGDLSRVEHPGRNDEYWLAGHPEERIDDEDSHRENEVKILNPVNDGYIEGKVADNASYADIKGQSGGPIIKLSDSGVYMLAGIQSRMAAKKDTGTGRIHFMPISFFDEIIADNKEELAELYPLYLYSFEHLKEMVLEFKGCIPDIPYTREFLRRLTRHIIENKLTPIDIKEKLQRRLLVYGQNESALNNRGLWIAWLELLIILYAIKAIEIKNAQIENIFNKTRLIFSETSDDWTIEIKSILKSDFKGLEESGRILVATNGVAAKKIIPARNLVENIKHIQLDEFQIDRGEHPLKKFSLVHLSAFQDRIIQASDRYCGFDNDSIDQLCEALGKDYEEIFK